MKTEGKIKKSKFNKLKLTSLVTTASVMLMNLRTYAATTIGTQEVEIATQNVKDAVIKLAMPVRFCSYVCEYCNNSNKINC